MQQGLRASEACGGPAAVCWRHRQGGRAQAQGQTLARARHLASQSSSATATPCTGAGRPRAAASARASAQRVFPFCRRHAQRTCSACSAHFVGSPEIGRMLRLSGLTARAAASLMRMHVLNRARTSLESIKCGNKQMPGAGLRRSVIDACQHDIHLQGALAAMSGSRISWARMVISATRKAPVQNPMRSTVQAQWPRGSGSTSPQPEQYMAMEFFPSQDCVWRERAHGDLLVAAFSAGAGARVAGGAADVAARRQLPRAWLAAAQQRRQRRAASLVRLLKRITHRTSLFWFVLSPCPSSKT